MATRPPLSQLALKATSVADDLGFVALVDLSSVIGEEGYRLIGGHMVTLLVARWELGHELYRETGDADLGVAPVAVRTPDLVNRFLARGYERRAGNRFARPVADLPLRLLGADARPPEAVIDVLIPSYTRRPRLNRRFGDHLVTTEVPGLATALRRPPVVMSLNLLRLNGEITEIDIAVPDEVGAIVLKACATRMRSKPTDIVDLWRCLEVGYAASLGPEQFAADVEREAAMTIRTLFAQRTGPGMSSLAAERRMSPSAATALYTRLRALIERVLGEE